MALINCPECGKRISNQAESCPNCGHPINFIKYEKNKREGCFLQTLNVGCLMILIFFAIIVILVLVLTVIKFRQ